MRRRYKITYHGADEILHDVLIDPPTGGEWELFKMSAVPYGTAITGEFDDDDAWNSEKLWIVWREVLPEPVDPRSQYTVGFRSDHAVFSGPAIGAVAVSVPTVEDANTIVDLLDQAFMAGSAAKAAQIRKALGVPGV